MQSCSVVISRSSSSPPDKSSLRHYSFEELFLEALQDVLGESAKETLYFNLKKTYNLDKKRIPHKLDEFVEVLEKIFGFGAYLIEIEIMKSLHRKFGNVLKYFPKTDELLFTEYLRAVKLLSKPAKEKAQAL